jgi:hypothetical protein
VKLNDRVALKITGAVGTMPTAYLFAVLALVSLPGALASGSALIIVGWLAQTFLQLVLLPIIMVGQRLQQTSHEDLHDKIDKMHAHLGIGGES